MIGRIFRALDAACDRLDKKPTVTETISSNAEAVHGSAELARATTLPRKRPFFAGKWEPVRLSVKTCPRCVERVKRDAQICKHCSYGFSEADEATLQSFEAEETEALIALEGHSLKLQKGCLTFSIIAIVILALVACGRETPSEVDEQLATPVTSEPRAPSKESVQEAGGCGSSEPQKLHLWQSVGLMINTSDAEAEALVTRVLAKHNTVASDENVKSFVGSLLIFRDQDNVPPKRVLDCMDSGIQSPSGPLLEDTIAYCVTELAG